MLVLLFAAVSGAEAFLYQPGTGGQIWDPSVTWWRGRWYAHAMYQHPKDPTNLYKSGWLASSSDGAHWEDVGAVAPEYPGDQWWKGFVRQIRGDPANMTDDALFIMNHGEFDSRTGNNALRFLTSTDLKNWKVNSTSHPDPRWYFSGAKQRARWDHMYMSEDGAGSYIGFAVSRPKVPGFAYTWPAVQRSVDGIHWETHAPLNVTWPDGFSPTSIEEGGFERVSAPDGTSKFYLIGGSYQFHLGYNMWAFVSDRIDGPFKPVVDGFRLSGGNTGALQGKFGWLAAWCGPHCSGTADGTPLISNYMSPSKDLRGNVWLLPMRKPIVDERSRLRLAYWEGNDVLKGQAVPASSSVVLTCGPDQNRSVSWLTSFNANQHQRGGIVTATVSASSAGGSIGVVMEDVGAGTTGQTVLMLSMLPDSTAGATAELLRVEGNKLEVLDRSGTFKCGSTVTCGVATVTNMDPTRSHTMRVLFRRGMWEVYVDDLLAQTFIYGGTYPLPAQGNGRIGMMCMGEASARIDAAKAWQMTLSPHIDDAKTQIVV